MAGYHVLSEVRTRACPEAWYALASEGHFWMQWRLRAFLRQLADARVPVSLDLTGLDVGCGHGVLRRQLETRTAWRLDGVDLNEGALAQGQATRGESYLYDIHDRLPEFHEAYDIILLFDILEHIEDPRPFLEAALYHLKPGGWVFINVPALGALTSAYDRAAGHFRRYDRAMLRRDLEATGLVVRDMRYWGMSLLPLLVLRKFLLRSEASAGEIIRCGFHPPTPWVGRCLLGVMAAETRLLARVPMGTSLLAAAQKAPAAGKSGAAPAATGAH